MTTSQDITHPPCECKCCALVLAELEALRHEIGQIAGLITIAGIGQ